MIGDGKRTLAADEDVALIEEGVTVADGELLDQPRAQHALFQLVTGGLAALGMRFDAKKRPARIAGPAMRRRRLDIAEAKRRAEEITGQEAEIGVEALVLIDRLVLDPGGGMQRLDRAAILLSRKDTNVSAAQVERRLDAPRLDRMEIVPVHSASFP